MTNQMNKEYYFKHLEAVITDIISIGNSEQDLNEETINNMWRISLDLELVKTIKLVTIENSFLK
ncbi:hypothetical protein [Paenibacillus ehimensis]|uniref:hypothetical protein n=1 Tax=Paenibacillus ehimensis TaxID=79264 RepID=UPI0013E2E01F|nr:hypothetical protein [Paenibacillus ehimensis]